MRIFNNKKQYTYYLVFIVIFILMNVGLTFFLCPAKGASEKVWDAYYDDAKNVDTLFCGSSLIACSVNPFVYDDIAGTNSFNFGTPCQHINQSIEAIEKVVEDHPLQNIVLSVDYGELCASTNINAKAAFQQAEIKHWPFWDKVKFVATQVFSKDFFFHPESINYLFPWIYNNVSMSPNLILSNVRTKIGLQSTGELDDYIGKGYSRNDKFLSENTDSVMKNQWEEYGKLNLDTVDIITGLKKWCDERDICLIVIVTPHPRFDIVPSFEVYYSFYHQLEEVLSGHDIAFYDFNLLKQEIFTFDNSLFSDYEHMNTDGASVFSSILAKFVTDTNVERSEYFYDYVEYMSLFCVDNELFSE